MNHYLILIFFVLFSNTIIHGQYFTAKGSRISDYKGEFYRNFYPIEVKNLPNKIDCEFGLEKICFRIEHRRVSDLKISLMSPDGMSFWLTNRNGGERGRRYDGTCFNTNGFNGFIYDAAAPFRGEFIPDGQIAKFNNGQNPNGFWYLIVEDLQQGMEGEVIAFDLYFSDDAMCVGRNNCSLDSIQDCQCEEETEQCFLLPDLVVLPDLTKKSIQEFEATHKEYPQHLRFGVGMANIGNGPLELIGYDQWFCGDELVEGEIDCYTGEKSQQRMLQNIYVKQEGQLKYETRLGGTLYYDDRAGHNHYHATDWVDFLLLKKKWWTKNPKNWKVIAKSEKVSYCLMDSNICSSRLGNCQVEGISYGKKMLPNFGLGDYNGCNQGVQGISVGGVDYYGTYYEGQYIQLPVDLKSGKYYLYIVVDPKNYYTESNENNNTMLLPVNLSAKKD